MELALAVVGTTVGLATGIVAVTKYIESQRWKKSEFAASLLMRLHTDPELRLACHILDWSARRMKVPEAQMREDLEPTFVHKPETLREAMRAHENKNEFPWPQFVYRDTFDRFFTYLEQVEHFISRRLIRVEDVEPLSYWLTAIRKPYYMKESPFTEFLEAYGYKGVFALMRRFEAVE
jgi:hypothetical protein